LPRNVGSGVLRGEHDAVLAEFIHEAAEMSEIVDEHSEDVERVFARVEDGIAGLRKQLDRPIRMLVDLSAMTRFVSLGAVAMALNDSIAEYVDVFYAEAFYGDVLGESRVPILDQRAAWEAVAVPRLEGDWYPSNLRHFLVSVGFEAAQVARLVERWDPDRISVLFPSPSVDAEYEAHTKSANRRWMAQCEVGTDATIYASGADAVAVWSVLSGSARIDPARDNMYCLLCGSKPQALALALYALARERPAVMYVRPTVHVEKEISASGYYWRYRLRDRTVIA
jgi:hypothetical protein